MAHGIKELDRLVVGFVDVYGNTWHQHPNCVLVDGPVSLEQAADAFDYTVEKADVVIAGTDFVVFGNHPLVRKDGENNDITVVYPSVGERYAVIQNSELLSWIEAGVIIPYDVSIESAGTLLNGQKAFVNLLLPLEHTVHGDVSPTITRMMYSNSFGQESYQVCIHTTRVVCDNTVRIASAQGAANSTLRRFRHTKNAASHIEACMVDLASVFSSIRDYHSQMDVLAEMTVNGKQIEAFLDAIFPLKTNDDGEVADGRGNTRHSNQRDAIIGIFDGKDDLQASGIRHTRYSLFQAVTDWADHDSPVRNGDDVLGRFWDGLWGTKDKFKQKTLDAIIALR